MHGLNLVMLESALLEAQRPPLIGQRVMVAATSSIPPHQLEPCYLLVS